MRFIKTVMIIIIMNSPICVAETFVETIIDLSARDAVTIAGDKLYASNYNTGAVYQIELDGTFSNLLNNNSRGPAGIRVDQNNNIYIALYNQNSILKIAPDGTESTFASGVREPIALDWDSMANLYVSNFAGDTSVTKISPDGTVSAFASISALNNISSLCLDDNDDVYVTSYFSGDIYKVSSSGAVSLFSSSSAPGYAYLQFDRVNQVFYATVTNTNALMTIDMTGAAADVINTPDGGSLDGPIESATIDSAIGLAISGDGKHIYFATNTHIRRLNIADPTIDQVRPYFTSDESAQAKEGENLVHQFEFIDPNGDSLQLSIESLPEWLSFDGVDSVSGTPGSEDAGKVFGLTAELFDGFATVSQDFSISVVETSNPPPATPPVQQPTADSGGSGSVGGWLFGIILLLATGLRREMV
ncbi:hypothetical protein FLL45_07040 [Aliikangiella marina]|uniref:Dystroglycan-type cadherin-like domain-containing protein n=1 Tax=Aliikangiella marina TaxID=1712262 RepID=A0A545TBX2_9GAMM|nr:hypothetical protein [Aliikangiella marina]TQV74710.1 hypothetical protein FLL45_07040 [Aliikangiella marina]